MVDLHVHTHHSCDSEVKIEEYCEKAIQLGLKYICFTDHVDFNKNDSGYGYYNAGKFFDEYSKAKDKFSDKLNILSGIEFAEPHIYKKEFDEFRKLPYDFILGSVHYWINDMFPDELARNNFPAEAAFEKYWEEVYKAVSYGGFDAIAHFDFPKRYYKKCIWEREQIYDIFREMVKNSISLEINTSTLRKGLSETMPGKEFLKLYEDAGGIYVTIGADTHLADDLSAGYDFASSLVTGRLKSVVYIGRKPKLISKII